MNSEQFPKVHRAVERIQDLVEHWGWYLLLGLGLITAGLLAIFYSVSSTLISVKVLGLFVAMGAALEGIQAFKMKKWSGFFLHVALGLIYGVVGLLLITRPIASAETLTLLLGVALLLSGSFKSIYALTHMHPLGAWLLLNGLITLTLGGMIIAQLPQSGLWVIGTLVGVDMLLRGITWTTLALKAKSVGSK